MISPFTIEDQRVAEGVYKIIEDQRDAEGD